MDQFDGFMNFLYEQKNFYMKMSFYMTIVKVSYWASDNVKMILSRLVYFRKKWNLIFFIVGMPQSAAIFC